MGGILSIYVFRRSLCAFLVVLTGWVWAISPTPVLADIGPSPVFIAEDFRFDGPEELTGGLVKLQLHNHGKTEHHLQLLRLSKGKTPEDFFKALEAQPGKFPSWSHFVGGPNAIVPDAAATATVDLQEAWYVVLCLIPDREGKPHFQRGMVKTLHVTKPAAAPSAVVPTGITVGQMDFGFLVQEQIRRGPTTIKVHNQGTQPHELVLVELEPGSSIADWVKQVMAESGSPPGKTIGGITGLDQGTHGFFDAEFRSGRYGLICFFPDTESGAPHFTRGMMWDFTVE